MTPEPFRLTRTLAAPRSLEPVNATGAEQATFHGAFAAMEAGWSGTFQQLDAHLATA